MPRNNNPQVGEQPEKPPTELEQIHMTTNKIQNEVSIFSVNKLSIIKVRNIRQCSNIAINSVTTNFCITLNCYSEELNQP